MKSLSVLSLFAASSAAIDFDCGAYTFTSYYDTTTSEIVIQTTQPDQTWFGVLLGASTMTNTEAIVFFGDGASSTAKNYYSSGYQSPTLAAQQTLVSTVDSATDTIQMTTRRPINPNIANQFSIPLDTDINMGYAANDSKNSLSYQHTIFGSWILNLPSDGTASGGTGGSSGDSSDDDEDDDEDDDSEDDDLDDDGNDTRM